MTDTKIIWDGATIPALLADLERDRPLKHKLLVRPSRETPGTRFDGECVYVDFHFAMPWGSVQLLVLQGYAFAWGLTQMGMPVTKMDAGVFHSQLLDLQHYLFMKNDDLGDAFKAICVPGIMAHIDREMERSAAPEKMN